MKLNSFILIIGFSFILGCTQFPTEKQSVSDMRPSLSFKVMNDSLLSARILVDGLDMGSIEEFKENKASLRVLSGPHLIRVELNGNALVNEKIYLNDGVNKTLLIQ
jgi:hypothetical protein